MWVINPSNYGWEVGFYQPDGSWVNFSEHQVMQHAMREAHYLNGGDFSLPLKAAGI